MTNKRTANLLLALALGLVLFIPAARADIDESQQTQLNFTKPTRVSETVVLQPGAYEFRLANGSPAGPSDVVQILDKNEHPVATILTQPTERSLARYHFRDRTDANVEYSETTLNVAQAPGQDTLLKWFYPGQRIGHRFLYSVERRQSLAQQPVTTMMIPN